MRLCHREYAKIGSYKIGRNGGWDREHGRDGERERERGKQRQTDRQADR